MSHHATPPTAQHVPGESADPQEEHHSHVVPLWLLAAVFAALLVLTVVTVAVSEMRLGDVALLVAMVVAVIKASLVCLFFMHLFWDSLFNSIALIAAFVFVGLFIGLSIFDSAKYEPMQNQYQQVYLPVAPVKPPEGVPAHGEPGHNHATDH